MIRLEGVVKSYRMGEAEVRAVDGVIAVFAQRVVRLRDGRIVSDTRRLAGAVTGA
jgi:hypothetical protein